MCDNLACSLLECDTPFGECHCGCGEKTNIAKSNKPKYGHILGLPFKFLAGHGKRSTTPEYIINEETGCWEWQHHKNTDGYGVRCVNSKYFRAHRYMYEKLVGPIPENMTLDHLCRVRHCVNPDHMEVVTTEENTRRGSNTKLSQEEVDEIRDRYAKGGILQKELAVIYNVSPNHISNIICNRKRKIAV